MAVKVLSSEVKALARYPVVPIVAQSLDFVFTAPDVPADGVQFPVTGRELILVWNSAVGAQTYTITSVACSHGRVAHITAYSLDPGEFAWVPLAAKELFGATAGTMIITTSDVGVKVAVLQLPNLV